MRRMQTMYSCSRVIGTTGKYCMLSYSAPASIWENDPLATLHEYVLCCMFRKSQYLMIVNVVNIYHLLV